MSLFRSGGERLSAGELKRNQESHPETHTDPPPGNSNLLLDPEHDFLARLFSAEQNEISEFQAGEKDFITHLEELLASDKAEGLVSRMSGSLPRLLASLLSGSSVKELSDQVVSDPPLLANILKVVNSPFIQTQSEKD